MAKCNICGTRTWFFQTHRCKAKPKQEIGGQKNLINSVVSDPEPCRMTSDFHRPIQNHAPDTSFTPPSYSSECSSSSSWDSGSDSSSSSYSD